MSCKCRPTAETECPQVAGLPCDGYYRGDRVPFFRADGRTACPGCSRAFRGHPGDLLMPGLTVLCGGWRVKL